MTYRFNSDYTEGCHPAVLEKLVQTNMEQTDGYGLDPYCDEARKLIREAFDCPWLTVHHGFSAPAVCPYRRFCCKDYPS